MATFNFHGDQNAGIINNVAGDQYNVGGQHVTTPQARRAVSELRDGLAAAALDQRTAARAQARLAEIDAAMQVPEPSRSRLARLLRRFTELLTAAGSLSAAGSNLIGPLHTLAIWLGALGEPVRQLLLPVLG